ncbi:cryptochrome/photolyase family protein [Salinibaculum rarum]|uniref:cryptochrome/photolyase family protein n=1 Tax=Salinibaculum rarum TaxID=3058903 RepID=UPI00265DB01B|nr:deoxyribodipyrimidine photo-lyase [Salinibaculum sp. KK48]
MHLFWHRRDLRIPDNRGLARAASDDTVLPVFVVDEELLDGVGERQRAFWLAGVRELRRRYRNRGSDLLVRAGSPADTLARVYDEFDADRVYYNRHYRPERRERERRVDDELPTTATTDHVLVAPDRLAETYPNHGRFYDDWQDEPKPEPAAVPARSSLADVTGDQTVPTGATDIDLPTAGYEAARARYDQFLRQGIETYSQTRDDMTAAVERPVGAVSRLSPYIAAGMIGIREVWADATERHDAASKSAKTNIQKFRYELSWREQNYHLLWYNPDLLTANYKQIPNDIAWENDPEQFAAWTRGETGYPLVDAGMRQLAAEGYVHNRPRQNVASFLTRHLLTDWRKGAQYFEAELLDHDPANNYGNWQWIAGTGTDSVDVRIFDPVAQMAKYDDDATYVKAYVPELREVPPAKIVEWPNLTDSERDRLAADYPHPIVDRNDAYERAQRVFEAALGKR